MVPKGGDFEDIVEDDIIVMDDSYRKAKRNIDYSEKPDETFSRNHLVYKKRGFAGFSDFSIVGKDFEESGFAPGGDCNSHYVFWTKGGSKDTPFCIRDA